MKRLPHAIHLCILAHSSSGRLLTPRSSRGNKRIEMSFEMAELDRFPGHRSEERY